MTEELKIIISAQYAELKKGCDEAKKNVQDMAKQNESTLNKFKDTVVKIAKVIGSALAFREIVNLGKQCIEAGAEAEAMSSQFTQVFGSMEGQAQKSLTNIAKETGVMENRMKGSYTQIASFAKVSGMDTADALALTERAMIAVADSSAFYDRSLEETTESLQSFLKGNYANVAQVGLSCTETTRNAKANELYGKSFKDLDEAQKQLTLLAMVEDANKLSGALGQASRESDTWTNQMGNLKQAWTDFQAEIGKEILPIAVGVLTTLVDVVNSAKAGFSELTSWVQQHSTALEIMGAIVGVITTAIIAYTVAQNLASIVIGVWSAGMTIATVATSAFGAVMAFITSPITLVVVAITALIAIIVLCVKHWDEIKEVAEKVWDKITTAVQSAVDAVGKLLSGLFDKIKNIWNSITTTTASIWDGIKNKITSIWDGIKSGITNAINNVKSTVSNGFNTVLSTATSIFNAVKTAITNPVDTAKNLVKSAIDTMKGFFNFSWSLPELKMPHISITGSFSLAPPSVPHFSISWYAKGGVFDKPTLFGFGSAIGGLGEAGAEAVVPLEKNTGWLDKIASRISSQIGDKPVVIQVDGKTFAQTSISCINDYTRTTGKLALNLY